MNFQQAIRTGFRKYADFTGVARRPEFWWWILFVTLVSAALSALLPWRGYGYGWGGWGAGSDAFGPGAAVVPTVPNLAAAWSVVILLPTLAAIVRRLRDAGHGWGHVLWLLLPIVGLIVLAILLSQPTAAPVAPAYQAPGYPMAPPPPPGPPAPPAS